MDLPQCINCCQSVNPYNEGTKADNNMTRNNSETFTSTFTAISKCDNIWMCQQCQNVLNILSDSKIEFLAPTKSNSWIYNILMKIDKEKESEECILSTIHNETETENLLLPDNNKCSGEIKKEFQPMFIEKIPVLKLIKLKRGAPSMGSAEIDDKKSCNFCCRIFGTEENRKAHVESAHKNSVYSFNCKLCTKKFRENWFYKKHLEIEHGGMEITLSCTVCKKGFHNQSELDEHKFLVHRQTTHPFKCNHCDIAFKTKEELEHLREHLIENHVDTSEAKAALFNRNHLKAKQIALAVGKEECGISSCVKMFPLKSHDKLFHIIFEHFSQKSCLVCQHIFLNEDDCKKHSKQCPFTECSECGTKYPSTFALVRHWTIVHNRKFTLPFTCELCVKQYRDYSRLANHYKWHAAVAGPRQFSCSQCHKTFAIKSHWQFHVQIAHARQKLLPPECKQCNANLSLLERNHQKAHLCEKSAKILMHSCAQCGLAFKSLKGLGVHISKHATQKMNPIGGGDNEKTFQYCRPYVTVNPYAKRKYICDICKLAFNHPSNCIRHLRRKHDIQLAQRRIKSFKCKFCDRVFSEGYNLKVHERCHLRGGYRAPASQMFEDAKNPVICRICKEKFEEFREIRAHFINCHENTKESEISQSNLSLQSEIGIPPAKHKTENICLICNHYFFTIREKEMHEDLLHKMDKWNCKGCVKEFKSKKEMRLHEISHKSFNCNFCSSVCSSLKSFRQHLQGNHTQLPFICEFCEKPFSTLELLNVHGERDHQEPNGRPFTCDLCEPRNPSRFVWKENLKDHLRHVHIQKKYECEICNVFVCENLSAFKNHMESAHKNFGQLVCNLCNKKFHDITTLACHKLNKHNSEVVGKPKELTVKPAVVEKCFVENEKRYKCPYCDNLFTLGNNLKRHMEFLRCKLPEDKLNEIRSQVSLNVCGLNKRNRKRKATVNSE